MEFCHGLKAQMETMMRTGDICDGSRVRTSTKVIDGAMVRVANGESPVSVAKDLDIPIQSIRNRVRVAKKAREAKS